MFNDRIVEESPGMVLGIVRINNMKQVHFSRNPKIVEFLYEYVHEFSEGVDRMLKNQRNKSTFGAFIFPLFALRNVLGGGDAKMLLEHL